MRVRIDSVYTQSWDFASLDIACLNLKLESVGIRWNKHIRPTQGKCIHQPNLQSLWPFGPLVPYVWVIIYNTHIMAENGRKHTGAESCTKQMQLMHAVQGVQGPDRRWCDCLQNVVLSGELFHWVCATLSCFAKKLMKGIPMSPGKHCFYSLSVRSICKPLHLDCI